MKWKYVRVLEIRSHLDLVKEPFGTKDSGQLRPQHLHRHLPLVSQILRQMHGRHSAPGDFSLDAVFGREGGGQAVRRSAASDMAREDG